jgi:predicted RNase H-like nuclease (RuvC/YqgF family)
MRDTLAAAACFVAVLAGCAPCSAQEIPAADANAIRHELGRINQTLETIAELMRNQLESQHAQLHQQEVEVLLRRLDIGARRLAPLEESLRKAEERKSAVDDEIRQMEAILNQLEEQIQEQSAEGNTEPSRELGHEWNMVSRRLELLRDRAWTLDQRVLELENELAGAGRDLEALERRIDEELARE